jgi:hypothetical protein
VDDFCFNTILFMIILYVENNFKLSEKLIHFPPKSVIR